MEVNRLIVDKKVVGEERFKQIKAIVDQASKENYCKHHGHDWNGAGEALFCNRCGYCNY